MPGKEKRSQIKFSVVQSSLAVQERIFKQKQNNEEEVREGQASTGFLEGVRVELALRGKGLGDLQICIVSLKLPPLP